MAFKSMEHYQQSGEKVLGERHAQVPEQDAWRIG
jgi:hypothetical protein